MDIDTASIRRLKNTLLHEPHAETTGPDQGSQGIMRDAMVRRIAPFAETMYLVMAADGVSDADEVATLVAALEVLCEGKLSRADLLALVEGFEPCSGSDEQEMRIAHFGALLSQDKDDREMAFTLAAVIAVADEAIAVEEHSLLQLVAEYFGISNTRAKEILSGVG